MNRKTVYLCGFMGCGKSTVGRLLAKRLGSAFTDLDTYIERKEGMKIPEIFEKHGEEYFRGAETEALQELGAAGGVVATGGGALLSDENAAIAAENGVTVFIDTPFKVCYGRIKGDKNRPIAYNSTREQLLERFEYRRPIYLKNSLVTVDGSAAPMGIVTQIMKNLI